MRDTDLVSAITGNTGDSGWRNMVPQVDSSDFPTQWVPSAYECSIIEAQAKEIKRLRGCERKWCMGGGFMTRKLNAHIVVFVKNIFTERLIAP